jgi:hypothetical protein
MPPQTLDTIFATPPPAASPTGQPMNPATSDTLSNIFGKVNQPQSSNPDATRSMLDAAFNPKPPAPDTFMGGKLTPAGEELKTDLQQTGSDIQSKFEGTGENAGQGAIQRGTGIVSDIASVPFKVVADAIDGIFGKINGKPVGKTLLNAPGQAINELGDKISNFKPLQDWVSAHPDAASKLSQVMGTAANLGNISGSILATKGAETGVPKINDIATGAVEKAGGALSVPIDAIKGKVSDMAEQGIKNDWAKPTEYPRFTNAKNIYSSATSRGNDISQVLTNNKLNPSDYVDKGYYNTSELADNIRTDTGKMSKEILGPALKQADYATPPTPIADVIKSAKTNIASDRMITQEARDALVSKLDASAASLEKQYPQGMSLTDMQSEKITRDYNSKYSPVGDIATNAEAVKNKSIADALRSALEAKAPEGVPVKEFNAELQKQYQAADYLDAINGKKAPVSILGKIRQTTGKVIGAGVGVSLGGGGILGGVGGYHIGGMIESMLEGIPNPFKASFLKNLETTNPEAFDTISDYMKQQGTESQMRPQLPSPAPLGSEKNPIIGQPPTSFESPATESKTTSVNPKTGTQYVRDLNTGEKQIINPTVSIPKELQPLAQEAQKYKTAEEFVSKQKPIYHGTNESFTKFDTNKMEGNQAWFTDNKADFANGNSSGSVGTKNVMERYIKPGLKFADEKTASKLYTDQLIQEGYAGKVVNQDGSKWYSLFEPNKDLLTKSQLTDFYNKVKGKK